MSVFQPWQLVLRRKVEIAALSGKPDTVFMLTERGTKITAT